LRSIRLTSHITRALGLLTLALTFSACGRSVSELVAARTSLGAENPPLPPVEQRYPGFKQIYADVAEKVIPSVVSIHSAKVVQVPQFNPFEWFFGPQGQQQPQQQPRQEQRIEGVGSGFIISADGYILTNNHVVEGADDLTVTLADDREFTAKVVGTDPPTDLAVIKIEGASNLPVVYLGDSEKLRIGDMVLAIGSPFGLSETLTAGIISAKGRSNVMDPSSFENFIQTDAAINPGNSGGPLVDLNGAVVGINSAIYSRSGGSQGVGFAIPVNMARDIAHMLIDEGKVTRGYLGVFIRDISGDMAKALNVEPSSGVLVDNVIEKSPAEKAGIKAGDIITAINGGKVTSSNELRNRVAAIKPGSRTSFAVLRDGKSMDFNVVLEERTGDVAQAGAAPSESTREKTGLTLQNLTKEIREQFNLPEDAKGVVITDIDPSTPAARARLQAGDLILEVNRQPVASVAEFKKAIDSVAKDGAVLLRVQRDDTKFFAPLRLQEKKGK